MICIASWQLNHVQSCVVSLAKSQDRAGIGTGGTFDIGGNIASISTDSNSND